MSQYAERERAVRQARKFMEMTRSAGASEAEANLAMKKLSEIMEVFNLNADEIVLENLEYKQDSIQAKVIKGDPMNLMLVRLGQFCDVKVWATPGIRAYRNERVVSIKPATYHFFGTEANLDMAKYLFEVVQNTLEYEEKKFKESDYYVNSSTHRRRLTNSFRQGFIRRTNSRLLDLIEEMQKHEVANSGTGNSLVLCREQIRERKFQEQIGIKLGRGNKSGGTVSDYNAFKHGTSSANNVSYGRPVGNSSKTLLLS